MVEASLGLFRFVVGKVLLLFPCYNPDVWAALAGPLPGRTPFAIPYGVVNPVFVKFVSVEPDVIPATITLRPIFFAAVELDCLVALLDVIHK